MDQANNRPCVLFAVGLLARDGITAHIKTLSKGMMERGWQVAIASKKIMPDARINREYMASRGISYFEVPFPDFLRSSESFFQTIKALSKLHTAVRTCQADVIHVHGFGIAPFAFISSLLQGVPLVSTCHNTPPPRTEALAKRFSAFNSLLNRIFGNRIIAISKQMRDVMQDLWKAPTERIRLIHNGVNAQHFRLPSKDERDEARRSLGLDPDSHVACLVGTLSWRKGQHIFVRAIAHLLKQELPVIGLCAGEGPLEDKIKSLATELGVADHIRLLGHTDARQVYWASDVCVLPSKREGCPLVIAEAMLCGVVPVRTPAGGAEDQIAHGVNGYIVPFDDPEALARRIGELMSNPERRAKMAARSTEIAREKFTVDAMVGQTLSVYRELTDSPHSRIKKVA